MSKLARFFLLISVLIVWSGLIWLSVKLVMVSSSPAVQPLLLVFTFAIVFGGGMGLIFRIIKGFRPPPALKSVPLSEDLLRYYMDLYERARVSRDCRPDLQYHGPLLREINAAPMSIEMLEAGAWVEEQVNAAKALEEQQE